MRNKLVVGAIVGAMFLLAVLLFTLPNPPANAAELAAPTPVAAYGGFGQRSDVFAMWTNKVMTRTTIPSAPTSGAFNIQNHDKADVQVTLVKNATQNVTLTLQLSNDGVNWVAGPVIATNLGASGTTLQQYNLFGRFARVSSALGTTAAMTATVILVAK